MTSAVESKPKRQTSIVVWTLLGAFVLLGASCIGSVWVLQVPFTLATGWATFIIRVAPEIRWNASTIGLFVLALPIAVVLWHQCCAWLWSGAGLAGRWRWKWTMFLAVLTLLMFVAGAAATGVAHQVGWLINSPVPIVQSSFKGRSIANRAKCASNLRQIGTAFRIYAHENGGVMPRSLDEMLTMLPADAWVPELLTCPAGIEERPEAPTRAAQIAAIRAKPEFHVSYAFCNPPAPGPDGKGLVILHDRSIDSHEDGINVLYDDGTVDWFDEALARPWLEKLANASTTQLATKPAK